MKYTPVFFIFSSVVLVLIFQAHVQQKYFIVSWEHKQNLKMFYLLFIMNHNIHIIY